MSAPYFFGSSSPAIAYSPHYAAGYSAPSGLKTKVVHKYLPNVPTERNTNNIGYLLPSKRPDGTAYENAKAAGLIFHPQILQLGGVWLFVKTKRPVGTIHG
ncbi:hypothetical protein SRABI27_05082 [Pedobacter sp. Bi27]|nr:hypothetical protein SRABI36_05050 [Pedobacter sp. Bi36]CAH0317533.1 hypothetical protein SRABI27_05082 [Pedobacter sp. Bi27]CAH0319085.1 hypothetical protein SRABI126_05167 [Pedobacter sp. Bi126]